MSVSRAALQLSASWACKSAIPLKRLQLSPKASGAEFLALSRGLSSGCHKVGKVQGSFRFRLAPLHRVPCCLLLRE